MCGIAGFAVEPGAADVEVLEAMCARLAHRGPDDADAKAWNDQGVGLGHRRLSIIDPSPAGRNPMSNEDATVWVVHNGEIYNHRELRRELERAGHRFASHSDTEVIVHGYEEWGDDHVHRLRGMFAYALYDRRRVSPRLMLVRDRFGIKPLHYVWDGERLAFASEIKAMLTLPWVDARADPAAIEDYLVHGYLPAPMTAFGSVRKVRPGERLVIEAGTLRTDRYWRLEVPSAPGTNGDDAAERVRHRLADAVKRHLVSDVPVGLFLSGGLDSSSVAAMMREATDGPIRAYSIGFDVPEHSETHYAALVADRFGFDLRTRTVAVDDAVSALDHVARIHDEPFADASFLPTYRVSELARRDVKVTLSGDGGDEVFGGYWWYGAWLRSVHAGALPMPVRRTASRIVALPRLRDVTWLRDLDAAPLERYAALVELFPPAMARGLLAPGIARDLEGRDARWHLREHWNDDLDPLTRAQVVDLNTYLPGDILTKVDRASMAVSLEVRPPLLDHQLVEAVLAMPPSVRGNDKALLKRAMAGRIPDAILQRPKKGFSVPWKVWLGQIRDWAQDELRDGAAVQAGVLGPDPGRKVGTERVGPRLWSLLVLERWCRQHL